MIISNHSINILVMMKTGREYIEVVMCISWACENRQTVPVDRHSIKLFPQFISAFIFLLHAFL